MDRNQIEKLILGVLSKGVQKSDIEINRSNSPIRNPSEYDQKILKYSSELNKEALDQLIKHLETIPEILSNFNEKVINTGSGRTPVSVKKLAKWLVIRSIDKEPELAVNELIDYVHTDETPALAILAVSGIDVREPIPISKDIKLVPFESVPSSPAKEALDPPFYKQDFLSQFGFLPHHTGGGYSSPKSALIKNIVIYPKLYDENNVKRPCIDFADLKEACEFLTLISDSTPVPVGWWVELKEGVPCKENLGISYTFPAPDTLSSRDVVIDSSIWQDFKILYERFSKMSQSNRDLLRVPIQRINQARRRKNDADKAIDQGVAFEALFLNDKTHKEQISFTFRLRASLFLGETFEQRQKMINFFSAFYSCRSQAAHTGKLDNKIKISYRGKVDASSLLKESDDLCVKSIIKIINNGGFPAWDSIVLAVGKPEGGLNY